MNPGIDTNTFFEEDRIMFYPPFAPPIAFDVKDLLVFLDANDAHPLVLARLMGLGHLDGCSARQWANLGRVLNMPEIADMSDDAFSAVVLGILGDGAGRGFMESREGLGG